MYTQCDDSTTDSGLFSTGSKSQVLFSCAKCNSRLESNIVSGNIEELFCPVCPHPERIGTHHPGSDTQNSEVPPRSVRESFSASKATQAMKTEPHVQTGKVSLSDHPCYTPISQDQEPPPSEPIDQEHYGGIGLRKIPFQGPFLLPKNSGSSVSKGSNNGCAQNGALSNIKSHNCNNQHFIGSHSHQQTPPHCTSHYNYLHHSSAPPTVCTTPQQSSCTPYPTTLPTVSNSTNPCPQNSSSQANYCSGKPLPGNPNNHNVSQTESTTTDATVAGDENNDLSKGSHSGDSINDNKNSGTAQPTEHESSGNCYRMQNSKNVETPSSQTRLPLCPHEVAFSRAKEADDTCRRCGQRVYFVEKKRTSRFSWHNSCFTCAICKRRLEVSKLFENSGEIFCGKCYQKNFGLRMYGFGAGAGVLNSS